MHDLERHLLVGDGLEHAEGDRENDGSDEGHTRSPNRELCVTDLDGDKEEDERDDAHTEVPEAGDFRIGLHETGVYVALILESTAEAADNVFAEPD